jgi:hypothetical protein
MLLAKFDKLLAWGDKQVLINDILLAWLVAASCISAIVLYGTVMAP